MKDLEVFFKFFLITAAFALGVAFCSRVIEHNLDSRPIRHPAKTQQRYLNVLKQDTRTQVHQQAEGSVKRTVTITRERFEPKTQALIERTVAVSKAESKQETSSKQDTVASLNQSSEQQVAVQFNQPSIGFGLGSVVSPSGMGVLASYTVYALDPFRINAVASWNFVGQPGPRLGFSLGSEILPRLDLHIIAQAGLFSSPLAFGPIAVEPAIGLSYRF